jgi:hypothetical protein
MIFITIIEDLYIISHFPEHTISGFICAFRKGFLPEKTLRQIRSLPIFQDESCYVLNDKQDRELIGIFRKIISEQDPEYVFSEDLQRTYLMELIHFITKIHQKAFPFVPAVGN